MENNSILKKFTSTKFILTVLTLISIVGIALHSPASLTSEVIVGLLGIVATYSGSNSFLSALALRGDKGKQQEAPAETNEVQAQAPDLSSEVADLQTRMSQTEATVAEIIELLKQIMAKK